MNKREEILKRFGKFLDIIETLRDPEKGCPWDRKQTSATMKEFFLEECYELIHEMEKGDKTKTADELGDVMLLVALTAQIEAEGGHFDMGDVIKMISDKLIERHPHVFGADSVENAEEVIRKWDEIKREKKKAKKISDDLIMSLPPVTWAYKVQKRLANIGFDFKNAEETLPKVKEEFGELMHAIESADCKRIEDEMGDMFFALINYARHSSINPDMALVSTITKFIARVKFIEENAHSRFGREFKDLTMAEMDQLWEISKKKTAAVPGAAVND